MRKKKHTAWIAIGIFVGLWGCGDHESVLNHPSTSYLYTVQGIIRDQVGIYLTDQEMRMAVTIQGTSTLSGEEGHAMQLLSQEKLFKPLCSNTKTPGDSAVQARTKDGAYAYRIFLKRDAAFGKDATVIITKFVTKPGTDAFYPCLGYITDYSVNVWQIRHNG